MRAPILELGQLPRNHCDLNRQATLPQILIALRLSLLAREGAHLRGDLQDHVLQSLEVQLGPGQPLPRDPAAILVLADARGLFEQTPAFLRALRENRVDHAALDDRVGVGTEPGIPAELLHIAQATGRTVDRVLAAAVAEDGAADLDFAEGHGQHAIFVGDPENHGAAADGTPVDGPLKNHLLHSGAAHDRRPLLAQHPANRVADVGFSAAVGSHDRRNALVELDVRALGNDLNPCRLSEASLIRRRAG